MVDAGQDTLSNGPNALHEAAHVLVPTNEPHGAEFVRVWLDLLARFGPCYYARLMLIDALKLANVQIDAVTSRLAADGAGLLRPP